jgi:proline dehydrogenase
MGLARSILLKASASPWLRRRAPKWGIVRRAVRRFMPGESFEAAAAASSELKKTLGVGTVLTKLGEDIGGPYDAKAVLDHYLWAYDAITAGGHDIEISIKPTQLGLSLGYDTCLSNLEQLAAKAAGSGRWIWIDMESSAYTDATLELAHALRRKTDRVGVCVQAYLYRTKDDLEKLISEGIGIRLVKGAYLEPREIAFPTKKEVDGNYFALADRLLKDRKEAGHVRAIFGTHDTSLIARLEARADELGLSKEDLEFQLLFGIQRAEQRRLTAAGRTLRVLISYGESWFPWYMRRLAERPANVWFVLKNAFKS